ncbi:MAG: sulfite exporter TauE/SafE family protein, partial [Lachnospiraceae bacterium]|nr:sulfite exporter TauE/SafE family protein [Lachnospiraceae bacterium]
MCAAGYDIPDYDADAHNASVDPGKNTSRKQKIQIPQKKEQNRKYLQGRNRDTLYIFVIILGLYVIATQCGLTQVFQRFPTVSEERVGYAVLFVIGLFTSVHCIAMCGGINLTQSVSGEENAPVRKNVLYNAGRLTGYTVVGRILGLIGEAASVTLRVRGL